MAASKSSAATTRLASAVGDFNRLRQRLFLRLLVKLRIGRTDIFATVLLLLDADDVGRALVAGEQVIAVLSFEEFSQRLDAADDEEKVVLLSKRKYRIDKIVTGPLFPQLNF